MVGSCEEGFGAMYERKDHLMFDSFYWYDELQYAYKSCNVYVHTCLCIVYIKIYMCLYVLLLDDGYVSQGVGAFRRPFCSRITSHIAADNLFQLKIHCFLVGFLRGGVQGEEVTGEPQGFLKKIGEPQGT